LGVGVSGLLWDVGNGPGTSSPTNTTTGAAGKVFTGNNIEVNTTWAVGDDSISILIPGTDVLFSAANGLNPPPYAYNLDAAASIPAAVTNGAGAGKGPFAP
jgi:hypothetical protein